MTKLSDFNLSELGIFIGVCSSALVAVVLASQKSKCSKSNNKRKFKSYKLSRGSKF